MNLKPWHWAFIGAFFGVAFGGFIHKSKATYDADLVAYQNLAPTVEPTPVPTDDPEKPTAEPTSTHNCLTPEPTETPEPKAVIAAREAADERRRRADEAARALLIKEHGDDFIPMPMVITKFQGYPVEFRLNPIPEVISDTLAESDNDMENRYAAYYHIRDSDHSRIFEPMFSRDATIINGFARVSVFSQLSKDDFESLHKPFYGIKVIQNAGGRDGSSMDVPPPKQGNNKWVYCVWSLTRKAPIPFAFPSQAIRFIKRQTGKQ